MTEFRTRVYRLQPSSEQIEKLESISASLTELHDELLPYVIEGKQFLPKISRPAHVPTIAVSELFRWLVRHHRSPFLQLPNPQPTRWMPICCSASGKLPRIEDGRFFCPGFAGYKRWPGDPIPVSRAPDTATDIIKHALIRKTNGRFYLQLTVAIESPNRSPPNDRIVAVAKGTSKTMAVVR